MERRGDIRAGTVQKGEKTFLAHHYDRSREWRESQLPEVSPRKHSAIYITSDICRPNHTHHREVNATNIPLCVPHCLPGTGLRWPLPFSLPFSFFLPFFLSFFLSLFLATTVTTVVFSGIETYPPPFLHLFRATSILYIFRTIEIASVIHAG